MDQQSFSGVIDAIFSKLAVRYGAAWLRQWEGVDMNLVKSDWGSELSGFASNLQPLRYALRHLPERCPNVSQFRAIANGCPLPEFRQLAAPVADPAKVAQATAKIGQAVKAMTAQRAGHQDWARRIVARADAGERINPTCLRFAREALGIKSGAAV